MQTEWIIFAAVPALCFYAILIFNRLVRGRNQVGEAWSGIDVQLRRRADLIPNLVATVRAYAAHERGVIEDVTARRSSILAANDLNAKAAADRALQGSLGRLFAVAEAYPQLKADQNFLALQGQLAEIEDQLQMARRYYNGTVRDFNVSIQSFPDVVIARALGYHAEHFFETDAASAVVPTVSLSEPERCA
jgi:LemA protein